MFLVLLILASTLFAWYIKWHFNYWKRQNFPYQEPKIPFGALDSVRRSERTFGMAIYDVYTSTQEKVFGMFLIFRPALLVRDAELANNVLAKDFGSFHDRGVYIDEEHNPMSADLFALQGQKWKDLRTKLAPSFTSGKLKGMFGNVEDVSQKMLNHLNKIVPDTSYVQIEMKEIFSHYAIDIVASVIFGLDVNSFEDPNNEFNMISKKVNEPSLTNAIRGTTSFLYPALEKLFVRLGWTFEPNDLMEKLVRKTIAIREKNNIVRKDMLQMLLQLRNSGKISENDDEWSVETTSDSLKSMSIEQIAGQLFLFYVAGYETSASAAAFTLYELSQNPEVLTKVQRDINENLEKHGGKLTYEAIQDMKYLDLCIMETVRKYPGLPILNRECTQDYPVPGTKHVIKKGTPIIISLFGIQRDPEYFPDPLRYDPERYLPENKNYHPKAYMPFGEGPRHCIAQRMGKVNVKVGLVQVLRNFDIEVSKKPQEIEIANYGVGIMPKGGINLRLARKKL